MLELKFYKSPWKATKLILLSLPFVLFSLYDIVSHNQTMPSALSWFCLCFFGLGIPLGLFNLFDKRPELIISEDGIFDRLTTKQFINWDFIKDSYLKEIDTTGRFGGPVYSKQIFICLVLDPNAPIILNANKTLVKLSESLGFQGISIGLSQLQKKDWHKLVDFTKAMANANASERKNLLLTTEI
jgi:hypothetical protein